MSSKEGPWKQQSQLHRLDRVCTVSSSRPWTLPAQLGAPLAACRLVQYACCSNAVPPSVQQVRCIVYIFLSLASPHLASPRLTHRSLLPGCLPAYLTWGPEKATQPLESFPLCLDSGFEVIHNLKCFFQSGGFSRCGRSGHGSGSLDAG